jgi:hypothetical protein
MLQQLTLVVVCISLCAWGPPPSLRFGEARRSLGGGGTPTRARSAAALRAAPFQRLASLLFFVTSDCPISNFYAPEIQTLCSDYGKKGMSCTLVYEDVGLDDAGLRKHLAEYGYQGITSAIDRDRSTAKRVGASITPQAVVVVDGVVRYRGRIDNRYEAFGKPRRVVTAHDLRDALEAVLAGRPVPNPETPAIGCTIVPPDFPRKQP